MISAMSLEESRRSQRPYRYGMVLLCVGALINWLGLAENYVEPVRYVGVACIVAGALLICAAMCCWLHAPPTRTSTHTQHSHPITAQVTFVFVYLWRDSEFIRLPEWNSRSTWIELERKLYQRRITTVTHTHINTPQIQCFLQSSHCQTINLSFCKSVLSSYFYCVKNYMHIIKW